MFASARPAGATWAVVASDPSTREVGVAFASCLEAEILGEPTEALIPMVFVPGKGAGIYTETVDTTVEFEMIGLLNQGLTPQQVLDNISLDDESRARGQYSVVTVDGASGVKSGATVEGEQARGASYSAHASNSGPAVLDAVTGSFEAALLEVGSSEVGSSEVGSSEVGSSEAGSEDTGVDSDQVLAGRLVDALVAGSEAGGDSRCGDQTALFAQVVVVGEQDTVESPGFILTATVARDDGQNPVEVLAQEYEAGSQGLMDVGIRSGRGAWIYFAAGVLGLVMVASGFVVFRFGMGDRAARR